MNKKILMKGNEALAEAAIRAGLKGYFGYPITPQSEILEYLSRHLVGSNRVFLQAESEVAAINMVYGAAGCGERVMTSTSSPGFSLMQEGISYIACAELPCLLVNVVRGGPGLGTIQPSQGDYFQAVKGGGHGDYKLLVYAPNSVQEMADFVYKGFDAADKYRTPVLILTDGALGQMMEPVVFPDYNPDNHYTNHSAWATRGKSKNRDPNVITTLNLEADAMKKTNIHLQAKYKSIMENEVMFETIETEDADFLLIAFGLTSRIAHKALEMARENNIKVGLLRPQTLFPFPTQAIAELAENVQAILTIEMNAGQMVEDVRLAVNGRTPVYFYGRMGGVIPQPNEIYQKIKDVYHSSSKQISE